MGSFFYGLWVIFVIFMITILIGILIDALFFKIKLRYLVAVLLGIWAIISAHIPALFIYIIIIPIILIAQLIKIHLLFMYKNKLSGKKCDMYFYMMLYGYLLLVLYINYWTVLSRYLPAWNIINPSNNKTAFFIIRLLLFIGCMQRVLVFLNLCLKSVAASKYLVYTDSTVLCQKINTVIEDYANSSIDSSDAEDSDDADIVGDNDENNGDAEAMTIIVTSILQSLINKRKILNVTLAGTQYWFNPECFSLLKQAVNDEMTVVSKISIGNMRETINTHLSMYEDTLQFELSQHKLFKLYLNMIDFFELVQHLELSKEEINDFILNYNDNIALYEFEDGLYYVYDDDSDDCDDDDDDDDDEN